jgi:hypothetical protein
VRGLFAPMEIRLVFTKGVPLNSPGAKISLFSGPRGSHAGGTWLLIIIDVRPLPPSPWYSRDISSIIIFLLFMFTCINFIYYLPFTHIFSRFQNFTIDWTFTYIVQTSQQVHFAPSAAKWIRFQVITVMETAFRIKTLLSTSRICPNMILFIQFKHHTLRV